jgi:hypothetical protein
MSALVWVLMLYSAATVTLLTITEGIPVICGMIYDVLCFMALACHAKTSLTDPGSVPLAAIPSERQRLLKDSHSMCGQCQTFKPPMSHHCRICNRCISRMDHHCPWVRCFVLFSVFVVCCCCCSIRTKRRCHNLNAFLKSCLSLSSPPPLLCLDEQLRRGQQSETFLVVFGLHLDLCCLCLSFVWMELFLLCR